jgi:enamine deaminase RidA (YjgF/YER057c/UK114 family)
MGDLIFVAGQVAEDDKGQLVLTTSLAFRPVIHEVRSKVFGSVGHYPASTLAVITSLTKPEFLIEIDAIALRRATAR